jgi:ATP-grasp domain
MNPHVLLATTCRWFSTARLAVAFANFGCRVEVVCPSGHPLLKTNAISQHYRYHGVRPLDSFRAAIRGGEPDIVIPCDDLATLHLHHLYFDEACSSDICALLERSLGRPDNFPLIDSKSRFMTLAAEQDVRVPDTSVVESLTDVRAWLDQNGLPAVLKADGTWGGVGIRIAKSVQEAERAFQRLKARPLAARALKRAIANRDTTLLLPYLRRDRAIVSIQRYVSGRDATSTVASWQGSVLAGLSFEVLEKGDPTGPSSVLKVVENREMSAAVKKMVARLGLSGFYGFDFVIEERTGNAYLIEMNPRATQTSHLCFGPGRHLTASIFAALQEQPVREMPSVTEKDTIALFPQEWHRSPKSEYLRTAYHDVPWDQPELLRTSIKSRTREASWWSSHEKWTEMAARLRQRREPSRSSAKVSNAPASVSTVLCTRTRDQYPK